jgi:hypothetical protein
MSACPDCGEKLGARYGDDLQCWSCFLRTRGLEPNRPVTAPRRSTEERGK